MTSEVGSRDPPGSPPPRQILDIDPEGLFLHHDIDPEGLFLHHDIDPEGLFLRLQLDSRRGGLGFKDSFTACTAAGAHCEGVQETAILLGHTVRVYRRLQSCWGTL